MTFGENRNRRCAAAKSIKGCPTRGHHLSGKHGLPSLRYDGWTPVLDGIAVQPERNSYSWSERQTVVNIKAECPSTCQAGFRSASDRQADTNQVGFEFGHVLPVDTGGCYRVEAAGCHGG